MKKSNAISARGALAQESRLDIFRLLIQKGSQGLPAGEIWERLGLPPPTLSFHLNQLRYAGLVSFRRESRSIIYTANYKAMNSLLTFLTENCCAEGAEICVGRALRYRQTVEPTDRKGTERRRGIGSGFENDNAKANP
jgi:ArsR family transcriptional regulator